MFRCPCAGWSAAGSLLKYLLWCSAIKGVLLKRCAHPSSGYTRDVGHGLFTSVYRRALGGTPPGVL